MTTQAARPPITPERFGRMDSEGYELIDGRLVRKPMGAEASWIQGWIGDVLRAFVRTHDLGIVFESECGYACFRGNRVRKPDVSFVLAGRIPGGRPPQGDITIPPDLAVEVVSPQEKAYQLDAKVRDFLSVSVPLIWIVYPESRTVQVRAAGGVIRELSDTDELTGDPVLPGFRVRVADLFPSPPARS
ncbi:MAG: Uma2 family endonuclease [Gemmataceae bacterium]